MPLFNSLGIDFGSSKTIYTKISLTKTQTIEKILDNIPSYITYLNDEIKIGKDSKDSVLENINSTYTNLSKIFAKMKVPIYKLENEFSIINKSEIENPEKIVSDYFKIINNKLIKEEMNAITIAIPDYNTQIQKETLHKILSKIGMKRLAVINESSAITIYYGYKNYSELFNQDKNSEITPNYVEKEILFIDGGNSKISFITSKYTFLNFTVLNVITLPSLGGRNFDQKIESYVIDKFRRENKLKVFNYTNEMRFRLIEEIKKKREELSFVEEVEIEVKNFYNDINLNVKLNRKKFEKCISELLNVFTETLNNLKNKLIRTGEKDENGQTIFEKLNVSKIEMCGELMNTPILKDIIEKTFNFQIEKSLNPNDYISIGCSLMGLYFNKQFPKRYFQNFYHFNYYRICYSFGNNLEEKLTFVNRGPVRIWKRMIELPNDNNIKIIIEYAKNEMNIEEKIEGREIMIYDINCNEQNKKFCIYLRHDQKLISEHLVDEENKRINGNISIKEFAENPYWIEILNKLNKIN